jgi:NADPH-dependent 2,4-dienoyl-CoA reductase/sulfur reductase-like enzyme
LGRQRQRSNDAHHDEETAMKHVILGAGPAGVIAAETIRKHAPYDTIVLVGDEAEPPYSRMAIPYLLIGKVGESGTHLRHDPAHFTQLRIDVRRARCTSVDGARRSVSLNDGSTLLFDTLLIATGSRPVSPPIPGIDSPDVHPCWTPSSPRRRKENGCCRWAPASSAASSWSRSPRAA